MNVGVQPPDAVEPLLSARGITKSFSGILANDRIDLDIHAGEIHAVLGENGAGKSTLMKILYGFYRADAGKIRFNGHPVTIRSPHDARRQRIGMVFQQYTLIPAMTVAENIALCLPHLPAVLDEARLVREIVEVATRYGLSVDPTAPVWRLSVGEQQKVEIVKLLMADARLLILDEPTRALAPHEIDGLFGVFAGLRRDHYAVAFITHKLQEVLACADRITVLRRGRVAGTLMRSEATERRLVSLMFGAMPDAATTSRAQAPEASAQPLLELRDVHTSGNGGARGLAGITLTILPGEIVGVAGVSGNGQRELGDVIVGLEPASRGTKLLWGQDATWWSVAQVRTSGVAFIPEDVLKMALVPQLSALENMALADTQTYARRAGLAIAWSSVREDLERFLRELSLDVPPLDVPVATFSGGTLQRVSLARELARHPRLIIAFYPTRGLDVRSATAVRDLLLQARNVGTGVLLISEDLAELFSLSDRLLVLHRGRVVGAARPEETTAYEVGRLMTGADHASGGHRQAP